jgi:hypothetical protein
MSRSREISGLVASIATSRVVGMSGSVHSQASKKDGAPIRPATDRAQGGDAPAFLTDEVLLRFEEGLRAQREQRTRSDQPPKPDDTTELRRHEEGRPEPDAAYSPPGARALGNAGLMLCALLIVLGAAALGALKARTAGPSHAPPVNIEAPGPAEAPRSAPPAGAQTVEPAEPPRTASVSPASDGPRQPTRNAVKSPTATPSPPSPAPPNEQPVKAQAPAAPAASETAAAAQRPVEDIPKGARTKSRARHARFRVRH